jgi:hypothetical protein
MKEIGELATKITFSLDEINVLGSQSNVAMALQQFHQVDLLQYEKREKEVPHTTKNETYVDREIYERIMIRVVHNRNYKFAMSVEHTCPVSTTIDVSPITSLEKYRSQ